LYSPAIARVRRQIAASVTATCALRVAGEIGVQSPSHYTTSLSLMQLTANCTSLSRSSNLEGHELRN
jgi:hypothetical protein